MLSVEEEVDLAGVLSTKREPCETLLRRIKIAGMPSPMVVMFLSNSMEVG